MNRELLRAVAADTIEITAKRKYLYEGREVSLPDENYSDVIVLSPDTLVKIKEGDGHEIRMSEGDLKCYLFNADSFEAARLLSENPLVMNFANAIYPGGGFLNGARAQEESLCRCSTLYASLSSQAAREMYDYNALHLNPVDSDYMLLSPHVTVFRDAKLQFLEKPFPVSVITVPAPNRYDRAVDVPQDELDLVMKERLRKMLYAAAFYGYHQLVLGAWGCGAFGNSARRVARYFYELFYEDGMDRYFDTVVFAILRDKDKIGDFSEVFGEKLENYSPKDLDGYNRLIDLKEQKKVEALIEETMVLPEETGYLLATSSFPICSHSGADDENIGYAVGIMNDGTPFEAEYWRTDGTEGINVVLPVKEDLFEEAESSSGDESVVNFKGQYATKFAGILCVGMTDLGQENEDSIIEEYVNYLCRMQILRFTSELYNGAVFYRSDAEGNDLAEVKITFVEDGKHFAETDMAFIPFENNKPKHLKIVK